LIVKNKMIQTIVFVGPILTTNNYLINKVQNMK